MQEILGYINSIVIIFLIILISYFLKQYLPSYFKKKGENLATKEDIREITDKIENVKSNYAKEIEAYKQQLNSLEKRKEISAQVIDLINRYKEIPPQSNPDQEKILRKFEQDYYKLVPWIPSDILKALNNLFLPETSDHKRPDVKDVIISVRKSILSEECGEFSGKDIIHFVSFTKK